MRLDDSAREWLALRRDRLRSAAASCDKASRDWNRRNAELTDLARRKGWDPIATDMTKRDDPQLKDAYGIWGFFKDEVLRLAADIQAELAYRQLLALDDDPMRYQRDDEVPYAPVPPGLDGLSITGRPPRPINSPAGYASTETPFRRPGPKQGEAVMRGAASPTLRGGGQR